MTEEIAEKYEEIPPTAANSVWCRLRRKPFGFASACFLGLVMVSVLIWPFTLQISRMLGPKARAFALAHDPQHLSESQFQSPNLQHWFGTDVHGRDLLSRVLFGAQYSLLVGILGAVLSLVIGVFWGAIAGYVGGKTDNVMMRIVDIFYSMPSIILVIVLITTFEGALKQWFTSAGSPFFERSARLIFLLIGLGAVSWLNMARIVRGQVLSLRNRPFVEASRLLGAGPLQILFRHVIPNTIGVIVVYLTLTVPAIMLYESFLSYLGIGIQPPMASWGSLLAEGAEQLNPIRIYWWLIIFPGGLLVLTLLALNFLGDSLRDALDIGKPN
jgi:peptide/nickel transport system permease protein/oligopeptide transport system permease protein